MVEGARLESVYTVKRIEGSNPSLSAMHQAYGFWKLAPVTRQHFPMSFMFDKEFA